MSNSVRRTSNPKKNLTVSFIAFLILVAMIGAVLLFGPKNAEQPANPIETTQNVSQESN